MTTTMMMIMMTTTLLLLMMIYEQTKKNIRTPSQVIILYKYTKYQKIFLGILTLEDGTR